MKRSIGAIIEEHIKRWQMSQPQKAAEETSITVVTVSREAGSGGMAIAENIAKALEFDLFHKEIVDGMSESADVSKIWLETLDETGITVLDEWITSFVNDRHLWPDQYMKHLMKIIGTIGKHGRAVIVGRGANFILPPGTRLRVRVVAPMEMRVKNFSEHFNVSNEEAKRRVISAESDHRAFVRKYFNEDISDPANYDIVLNTGTLGIDRATEVIKTALR